MGNNTVRPDRYRSQRGVPLHNQEELANSILILGGFGTGNQPVGVLSSMAGVGHIIVLDPDPRVEWHNLSKSLALFRETDLGKSKAELAGPRLMEFNSEIQAVGLGSELKRTGDAVYRHADCIASFPDSPDARVDAAKKAIMWNIPHVDGAMGEGETARNISVSVFMPGHDEPCFACPLSKEQLKNGGVRTSCADGESMQGGPSGAMLTSSAFKAAGFMFEQIARILMGSEPTLKGMQLYYTDASHRLEVMKIRRNPECVVHDIERPEVLFVPFDGETTAGELHEIVRAELGAGEPFTLYSDRLIAYGVRCKSCDRKAAEAMLAHALADVENTASCCGGQLSAADQTMMIRPVSVKLSEIGVDVLHDVILRLDSGYSCHVGSSRVRTRDQFIAHLYGT
ncbi:MAG: ThiF family adenylyltransferase [Actinobacteria bacterium]|nr:ThiF family adenylyltransferase [Actinomycetota bacterium]